MLQLIIFILAIFLLVALLFILITIKRNQKLVSKNQIIKIESYNKEQFTKEAIIE